MTSSLAVAVGLAVGATPTLSQADALDVVPHIVPGLVGMRLGDALLSARSSTDLGLKFVKAEGLPETYTGFADASLELELAYRMASGPRIGVVGKLHGDFQVDLDSGTSSGTDSFDPEEQKALAYVQGAYGRLEAGYIHASSLTGKPRGITAGRGGLSYDSLNQNVSGLGARYRFRSGPNTFEIQADQNLRVMAGYQFMRAYRANTYTAGVDVSYAQEEEFSLPSAANSVMSGRVAQSFGAVAAGRMDYGTLFSMASAGAEHFRAADSTDDNETRLFGALAVSKKWGRTTVSAGAAVEHYLTAEYSRAELALGIEWALSRGITMVGGYNFGYANAGNPPVGLAASTVDHEVEAALRVGF